MEGKKLLPLKAAGASSDFRPLSQRILVVDDEGDSRQLSVELLTACGYEVEGVKDGAAGWDALQIRIYDLVLTDNKMSRMTGVEMIGRMRAARMTVPVIMATSHLPVFEFARRPWLQPEAALEKPFSNDDLLAAVKRILRPRNDKPSQNPPKPSPPDSPMTKPPP